MASALRRLLLQRTGSIPVAPAMLRLVRFCSTAPTQPPATSMDEYCCSSASIKPAAASGEEYCYTLGAFGRMQFSRKLFVPLDQYMMENEDSILQPVPMDRLIAPSPDEAANENSVDGGYNFFTSHSAKQFIRSGYLAAYFAEKLKLSISGAFTDGNVGVILGLNILAFLNLDTELSTELSSCAYPLTYSGFSSFLKGKMLEIYALPKARRMSNGLRELLQISHDPAVSELRLIYHPEFLSLEALASIYIESHRITRKQMPSTGEDRKAHDLIVHLNSKLGPLDFERCDSNPILRGWLGEQANESGLAGAYDLSVPPHAELDLTRLKKAHKKKLGVLARIAYGLAPPSAEIKKAPPAVYPRDPTIAIRFKETKVMDVHRHCMVHLVQDDTLATFFEVLPEANVINIQNKKLSWRDGVYLLLHNFGSYPHYLAEAFDKFGIWDLLDLEARCPIPQIFISPSFRNIDAEEGIVKAGACEDCSEMI